MISLNETSSKVLACWIAESSILKISLAAGALSFRGRGSTRSFDGDKLVVGFRTPLQETWMLEVSPGEDDSGKLSSSDSEEDPSGSIVLDLRFGSSTCTLEGHNPLLPSLMPNF